MVNQRPFVSRCYFSSCNRHNLLCQKKDSPDVRDKPVKQRKYIPVTISPSRKEHVPNKKDSDLWS